MERCCGKGSRPKQRHQCQGEGLLAGVCFKQRTVAGAPKVLACAALSCTAVHCNQPLLSCAPFLPSPRHALQHFSHLYHSPGQVVGTFQRIDIPVLPQLLQYEFVLFTGRRSVGLGMSGCRRSHFRHCHDCLHTRCQHGCSSWLAHWAMQATPASSVHPSPFPCPLHRPADCDVYFRQRIKLVDWGTPLPSAVGMR